MSAGRLPLGRQPPLISDMLALIQVSSMKQNKTDLGTAVAQKNTETLWD
ncbi:hypothetical protein Q644_24770 [Brucella intermedia 229E]|uniref:Uncharacterized protein n=1 Tax=Brucella intermedia 229E TaxID=1337887 RepID=U4VDE3_9HYPH|nr:hypothetical protein Q644_24770 [Brucella intermedia 229E]